jgi:hypothetical protein
MRSPRTSQNGALTKLVTGIVMMAASSVWGCSAQRPAVATPGLDVSDAVAEMCAGVPESERERPYFLQPGGIESVRELTGDQRVSKFADSELRGAEIALRATPGGTRHRLSRFLRCHIAWHDALMITTGFEDPLRVGQPDISFYEAERGLVIRIVGHDRVQGEEILRRAEALLAPSTAARD